MTLPLLISELPCPPRRRNLRALWTLMWVVVATVTAAPAVSAAPPATAKAVTPTPIITGATRQEGDFIVAVVNQEVVTNAEVEARLFRVLDEARRTRVAAPPQEDLRRQILDQLIGERAQLSMARDVGMRIDEAEIDRAVANVAEQNKVSVVQLREQLKAEGYDYTRLRNNLRDQILLERVREREVQDRIRITETDIEDWLSAERAKAGLVVEYDIAQVLISVPENTPAAELEKRRQRAQDALNQATRPGSDFAAVVQAFSDGPKDRGGALGLRTAQRLPDLFLEAVRPLTAGQVAPTILKSGAGFHVIKLLERRDPTLSVVQHHARHILLRPGPGLTPEAAQARLTDFKKQIESGKATFEGLAQQHSEDGSAPSGGDLGWAGPGQFVPEFETAMQKLTPGGVSEPITSRFGLHLIQLIERKTVALSTREQRETARASLRESKYTQAFLDWSREVRSRAYVELREPPL
ncbi:MAG: peptidylprolyl isomerase [Leptothrix ochracea]|uniref:peptidylprolyl isomerase n=1 Tax=Leptothrix ochracea TaxID=735331 RepID=UPI0034E2D2BD